MIIKKENLNKLAYAVTLPAYQSTWTVKDLIHWCLVVLTYLVPLLIGGAVIVFFFGIVKFMFRASTGDADGRKEGINFMIYGVIGITVMVSVWALVNFVTTTFGDSGGVVPQFPRGNIPTTGVYQDNTPFR